MKENNTTTASKIKFITAMFLFGTIGIFVRYISLPSSVIAFARGIIGTLFLLLITVFARRKISIESIRKNLLLLCLSGAFIGFNWIFLFEAYHYTTVATATLCYYMAPIFVMLASPFLLKEKLSAKKIICIILALAGMILVSGIVQTGICAIEEIKGILFGIGAAVLYSLVIIMNKKMNRLSAYDKTIIQLAAAALVVLPYIVITKDGSRIVFTKTSVMLLLFVGIIHTAVAYALYFGSMKDLKAQSIAIFSYIDPVVAILLSVLLLRETMELTGIIGAILILGATLISELSEY